MTSTQGSARVESPAIRLQAVAKSYGALRALDGVTLRVERGEFFGLLGPNGAGKTSLISIIAGLNRPTAGSVEVMGVDVLAQPERARRQLGVVPQELVFDPFFTVRETLELTAGYYGVQADDGWIDELLHHLDLTAKASANMRALSGGMKRRVLVGQALVHRPPVIVLDEPTAGVDVELRQSLWRFIGELSRAIPLCSPRIILKRPKRCAAVSPCLSRGEWWHLIKPPSCYRAMREVCFLFATAMKAQSAYALSITWIWNR